MLNWLQFILSSLLILPVSAAPWRAADQARARPSTGHPRHTGPVLLLGATQQLPELLELLELLDLLDLLDLLELLELLELQI